MCDRAVMLHHGRVHIHRRHLRAREVADHDLGRHVDSDIDPLARRGTDVVGIRAAAGSVNPVGPDRVTHGLAGLRIERPNIVVELVAARHDLVAIREILGLRGDAVVHAAIGLVVVLLEIGRAHV